MLDAGGLGRIRDEDAVVTSPLVPRPEAVVAVAKTRATPAKAGGKLAASSKSATASSLRQLRGPARPVSPGRNQRPYRHPGAQQSVRGRAALLSGCTDDSDHTR